ncbi:MAG TPA: hypothetical protein VNA25_07335 [Phycisphaerae bacterium]|nr:hypothetical protein [Phycisphaerae bacterium]
MNANGLPTRKASRTSDALAYLDRIPTLAKVFAFAVMLLSLGWSGHIIFAEQVGIPAMVGRNTLRVDTLEMRMERAEGAVLDIAINTFRLQSLVVKVDSLDVLAADTYCLVRAHALGLDPLAECTYSQRRRRNVP